MASEREYVLPRPNDEDKRQARELINWSGAQGNIWTPTIEDGYATAYACLRECRELRQQQEAAKKGFRQ